MAAVASNHVGESPRNHENEPLVEPTPSFTAVNGSASPAHPAKSRPDQDPQKEGPEGANHRAILPNHAQDEPHSATPSHHESSTNGQEPPRQEHRPSPPPVATQTQDQASIHGSKPPTPAPSQAQLTDRPASAHPPQHNEGPYDQRRQPYPAGHTRTPSNQPANAALMSPQQGKRKRSFDGEHDRRPEYENQGHAVYPMHNSVPQSPSGHRRHEMENGHPRDMQGYSPRQTYPPPPGSYPPPPQETYAAPPRMRDSPPDMYARPERHQLVRNDYDQPVDSSIAPPGPRQPYYQDPQDAHMASELQRVNRGYDSMSRENYGSPEDDDDPHGQYEYGTNRSSQDLDRKRRKRVFSNRTKTGCMTCRRRKKKCDEQHPECEHQPNPVLLLWYHRVSIGVLLLIFEIRVCRCFLIMRTDDFDRQ